MKPLILWLMTLTLAHAGGNAQHGATLAAPCVACHGQQGVSPNPAWPNLAGQHAPYLLKQMQDMKAGKTRNVPVMTGMLANLGEQDLADLAAYYASLPAHAGVTPKALLARGEQLYRGGDLSRQISACIACHGPKGDGNAEAGFPMLSGQNAPYTVQQLADFRGHKRTNDYNAIMQDISARMQDADMAAVAAYIAGLY